MVHIKINGHEIEVEAGTSVLKAAEKAGVKVPSLCYNEELGHFTSCMLCLVKDAANGEAYVPHPGSGVSPTRPTSFIVTPPVDVQAHSTPFASRATAPIVPPAYSGWL